MAISWTPNLAVGNTLIDDQHKELYRRIDQLLEACNRGQGRAVIGDSLAFLQDYIIHHFADEEALMLKYKYPKYSEQKAQHTHFIQQVGELKQEFDKDGPGLNVVIVTNRTVVQWLNTHIRNLDTELGAYLKEQM